MLDVFRNAFRLKITYQKNMILYFLKSLPLIKRALPDSLYGNVKLKRFALAVSMIWEALSIFLGKAFYLLLLIYLPCTLMENVSESAFLHIFVFLTVVGGYLNLFLFDSSIDKYYGICLMRMDARQYAVSNFIYFQMKTLVGLLPFTILSAYLLHFNIIAGIVMPFFVCAVKSIFAALRLKFSQSLLQKRKDLKGLPFTAPVVCICIVAAYALPALGWAMDPRIFYLIAIAAIVGGIGALLYIIRFPRYRAVYRELLKPDSFLANGSARTQAMQTLYQQKICVEDTAKDSRKTGYAYFNELFVRRHSKMLTRSAKRIALILLCILLAAAVACIAVPKVKSGINQTMQLILPLFLLFLYFINRGRAITGAMFVNCDRSMLTFRFYRQPKAVLQLFQERLKSVIAINLLPASVIAVGLPVLLYLSGGTQDPLQYGILFVSIEAMSIFFSVHTLVLYYLLQPYTVQIEAKSAPYVLVNSATYFICCIGAQLKLPNLYFGIGVSAFCILYVAVALLLVYRLAPKTFRLRN